MKPKPFSMVSSLAENTRVYLFNYAGDETDFATDKAAFRTELEKHIPIAISGGFRQNGIHLTGSGDITVTDVTTKKNIVPAAGGVDLTGTNILTPVVLYKGVAVPYSDFESVTLSTSVILLKATTSTTYPSNDSDDWIVYYDDPLSGYLTTIEAPTINLPLEQNSFNAVGHDDPVIKVTKRGDPDASGSLTVLESLSAHIFDGQTAPEASSAPGEDLLSRVYGSAWTVGTNTIYADDTFNNLGAPAQPFGIAVFRFSGTALTGGGQAGKVWAAVTHIYHCRLTSITPPQNVTGDSTDPVLRGIEFECQYPDQNQEYVIRTAA